jgi:hypothetical protein
MNVYQIYGTENLGWFTKEEAYKISENLHAAVYTFAFCEIKPQADLYPHEVQNSFYVGQSGNEDGKHSFYDQKVRKDMGDYKALKYGRYTTNLKMRMKSHYAEFEKQKKKLSEILEDVGHALCAAILDLIQENPYSRLPLSQLKNLMSIRNDLELNLQKYENGAMVPPAERFKNTTNRMLQNKDKKVSAGVNGKSMSTQVSGNSGSSFKTTTTTLSAGAKRSSVT